jgi:hypothetical protein
LFFPVRDFLLESNVPGGGVSRSQEVISLKHSGSIWF